jgi:hypothetical protein
VADAIGRGEARRSRSGGVYAFASGRQATLPDDSLARAAGRVEEDDGAIRATMNGRLATLCVEEGEWVEAGRRLAMVEAMKGLHRAIPPTLQAPRRPIRLAPMGPRLQCDAGQDEMSAPLRYWGCTVRKLPHC